MNTKRTIASTFAIAVLGLSLFSIGSSFADTPRHEGRDFFPLQRIHDKLHLTPEQEKTWQGLAQQGKAAHKDFREQRAEMKTHALQELGKTDPDLAGLAAQADRFADEQTQSRRQLRQKYLEFYATLSAEQKAIVVNMIKTHLEKADSRREKFQQQRKGKNAS